jgi:hypothetical protein
MEEKSGELSTCAVGWDSLLPTLHLLADRALGQVSQNGESLFFSPLLPHQRGRRLFESLLFAEMTGKSGLFLGDVTNPIC